MEELDLLKKSWNQQENYPKISEEKIYGMLHKNSSSAVKWIFIISIIEFTFGILMNVIMAFTDSHQSSVKLLKKSGVYSFYQIGSFIIWIVSIYFVYRFFINYKQISTTVSVKKLMESILNTRKTVKKYIIFNLTAGGIFIMTIYSVVLIDILHHISIAQHKHFSTSFYIGVIVGIIAGTIFVLFIFWLIYKVIYGFLLKRLKKNYQELEKIGF